MQVDWWLQPCAVFEHSFSGISWHLPQKWSQFNCMTLYRKAQPKDSIIYITLHTLHLDISKPTKPTPEIPYRLLSLIHQEPSKGFPFLHTLTALCSCISHMSVHHPYFCNHSPSNTCSNPLDPCNPSPQHKSKRLIVVSSMAYKFMILIW